MDYKSRKSGSYLVIVLDSVSIQLVESDVCVELMSMLLRGQDCIVGEGSKNMQINVRI